MKTQEAIKKRYSCRNFLSKPVSKKLIEKIIDAARLAPTARNIQPWEFIIVTDKENLKKLGSIIENGPFIADCSCCIIVLCKDTKYYLEDGCAATENILLSATDLGLASCWVAGDKKPYVEEIKQIFNIPKEFKLVSLIALGYPKDKNHKLRPAKRSLNELIHWEKF
jgi:nitroreductase